MYVGPQKGQVPGQVAVAPADVVEVLHRGDAVGLKPGDHKSGSAPKVHGPDPGGLEPVNAAYHRHPALQPDVGPHAHQLRHMVIAALENVFHEYGGAAAAQQRRHQHCLGVGGEARIRCGANGTDGPQMPVGGQSDAVVPADQTAAGLAQHAGDGGQVAVVDVPENTSPPVAAAAARYVAAAMRSPKIRWQQL